MELIPILATMILVGTVATFILAVAAYILYKIRERKGLVVEEEAEAAEAKPHVLIAPSTVAPPPSLGAGQPAQAATYVPPTWGTPPLEAPAPTTAALPPQPEGPSFIWEITSEGYRPVTGGPPKEEEKAREKKTPTPPGEEEGGDMEWI